jgi:repressor LexA
MITDKGEFIYKFICDYLEENGYPPTVREIAEEAECCVSIVFKKLNQLEKLGLISRKNSPRAIKVTGYKFVKMS